MSSIKIRVEDLIGSVGDDTAIGDWATDGARAVINVVPDSALWSFSSDHTDSGSGIAVDTLKVLGAHKDGYEAIEYPPNMKGRLASSNSIHKATTTSPAFYRLNGKVYVLPSGGTVVAVSIPTITSSTTAIASFPDEAEHVVILYTAVQGKLRQLTDKRANLPSDLNLAVIPTSPSLDLSIASVLSDISYVSPTAPTQPNTPSITSSDAIATGISQQTVSIGTAPSYIQPTLVLSSAPTINDLTIGVSAPSSLGDPGISSLGVTSVTVGNLGAAPSYDINVIGTYIDEMNDFIDDEEDLELSRAKGEEIQIRVQNELNNYNEENAVYQSTVQKAIQDAQMKSQEALKEGDMLLQAKIQDYSLELQSFQADVSKYQAEVNTEVQNYQQSLQKEMSLWQAEQGQRLDKYAKNIQDNLNKFNSDNVEYQSELQKSITQAQLDVQRLTAISSQADNIDLKNKANTLQAKIQDYQLELSRYSADLQKYNSEQSDAVNTMQVAIQKRASELQELAQLNQDKLAKYSQEIQAYGSETQLEIQDYTSKVQRYSQEHQLMLAELQVLQQQYQQGLQLLSGIPRNQEGNN